jgi:hypothetical protein
MRPIDPSKYFEGAECVVDHSTRRYKRGGRCVECVRRDNARKHGRQVTPFDPTRPPTVSREKISTSLARYASSITARERSARLDALIRGANPDETKTICAGDIYRASLPIGLPVKVSTYDRQVEARHAENDALRDALRDVWPRLPDVVTIPDVTAAVPPAVVEPINPTRWPITVSTILVELGAKPVPKSMGLRRYVVRGAVPARRKRSPNGKPVQRAGRRTRSGLPTVTKERPSARRAVGQRAATMVNAGPAGGERRVLPGGSKVNARRCR